MTSQEIDNITRFFVCVEEKLKQVSESDFTQQLTGCIGIPFARLTGRDVGLQNSDINADDLISFFKKEAKKILDKSCEESEKKTFAILLLSCCEGDLS